MAAGAGDHAAELGEDRAPVREPGQRVLAQQRLQPRALGDELLLELLGARGGLDAGEHLAVGDRLDQVVLDARGACPSTAASRRELGPHDHDDRGAVGHRVGLDRRSTMSPQHSTCSSATSGAHVRQRAIASSGVVGFDHLVAGLRQHPGDPAALRGQGMGQQHPHASTSTPWTLGQDSNGRPSVRPTARSRSTSRCICSISASTVSKRFSPRMPVDELQPQLAAVEVAVEVEQERLDEQPAAGDERRPHADRRPPRSTPPCPAPRRGRRRCRGRGRPARGSGTRFAVGKPSVRPRLSPWATIPRVSNGAPSKPRRLGDLARRDQPADVGRGDDLAVELDHLDHARLERRLLAQQRGVAARAVAEAEVLAHATPRSRRAARSARGR